jgi:hypothetical protein
MKKEEGESVEISVKELEEREAAKDHDSKKTDHYSRLGASFSKSSTLRRGGGSGRGRISMKKSLPPDT